MEDLGEGDYYDLTVPVLHNYLAEGLIHHNSGKTRGSLMKALFMMSLFPGYRVAIVRRCRKDLDLTTLPTLLKLLPDAFIADQNLQKGEITLKNGSSFNLLHLEKPEISRVLRGLEINGFILDQAEEILEETYDILETRCNRWDQAYVDPKIVAEHEAKGQKWIWKDQTETVIYPPPLKLLTANPDIELHWLYKRFHPDSQEWRDNWRLKGYGYILFRSIDNKFASQANLADMLSKDKAWVDRYVYGKWGRPEGIIFDVPQVSIMDYDPDFMEKVKTTWSLHRVLDHGESAPTCCMWYAVSREGDIVFFGEYYRVSDKVREHRDFIQAISDKLCGKDADFRSNLADPAIFAQRPMKAGGRWSVASEFSSSDIGYDRTNAIWWTKADNNETASRLRLHEYLWCDPKHANPLTGELGSPRIYFVRKSDDWPHGCDNAIKELKSAKRTKVGTLNGEPMFSEERDPSVPDHSFDCCRYAVMSRPTPLGLKPAGTLTSTFAGYSQLAKSTRRRKEALGRLNR